MENLQPEAAMQPTSLVEDNEERTWREHFARWRESGLSQVEYCHQVGVTRHQFKYWRRKLEPETMAKRQTKNRASDFVPVQVRPSALEAGLSLTLPNGIVMRGIDAGNVELVTRLVAKL